ncbi:MAG: phosphoserine phosphatase SerB [Alphaproteobacteria bacterium]
MRHIITLVAAERLTENMIAETCARAVAVPGKMEWLSPRKAAAVEIEKSCTATPGLRAFLNEHKTDIFITPAHNRRKKLLRADMDSTIVTSETLDELAAFAGLKDKIAIITAQAMEGKLDFETALRERVALLKGLKSATLHETLEDMKLSPGAKTLVATMKKQGGTCVLVSGGFTFFTSAIAKQCGFDFNHGNTLDIADEVLSGTVCGTILDKNAKAAFLEHYRAKISLSATDTMAIGDGANDIPMLKAAGLGLGYQPRDTVKAEIPNFIIHTGLTAALYAQGYREDEFTRD